ncbi:pyridoxal-dependent decarboxylase [Paenibacillus chitinolyticus]|nr:pyridoxal-dependent decarboxylase [Paenibacillus chitinolyticus]
MGHLQRGGAEANLTAVLTALLHHFSSYAKEGLRSLPKQPVMYTSAENRHFLVKAVHSCGVGTDSLRIITKGSVKNKNLQRYPFKDKNLYPKARL